jgi:hypothetical protein
VGAFQSGSHWPRRPSVPTYSRMCSATPSSGLSMISGRGLPHGLVSVVAHRKLDPLSPRSWPPGPAPAARAVPGAAGRGARARRPGRYPREGLRVCADHPLQAARREAEVGIDRGHRDDDDRPVEDDHEKRYAEKRPAPTSGGDRAWFPSFVSPRWTLSRRSLFRTGCFHSCARSDTGRGENGTASWETSIGVQNLWSATPSLTGRAPRRARLLPRPGAMPYRYSSWRRIQVCHASPSSRPFGARSRIG